MGNQPTTQHGRSMSAAFDDPTGGDDGTMGSPGSGGTNGGGADQQSAPPTHRRSTTMPAALRRRSFLSSGPTSQQQQQQGPRVSFRLSLSKKGSSSNLGNGGGGGHTISSGIAGDLLSSASSTTAGDSADIADFQDMPTEGGNHHNNNNISFSPPSSPQNSSNRPVHTRNASSMSAASNASSASALQRQQVNKTPPLPTLPPIDVSGGIGPPMLDLGTQASVSKAAANGGGGGVGGAPSLQLPTPYLPDLLPPLQLRPTLRTDFTTNDFSNHKEELGRQSQKSSVCSQDCTMIKPYLYLSGDLVAKNKQQLLDHGITHIMNVAASVCENYFLRDGTFEYLSFELVDNAQETISHFMLRAVVEIERVRKIGGTMLLHCHQGVSRSATLVIAYLMWLDRVGYEEAFRFVKQRRSICSPNVGFMLQLKDWEKRLQPNSATTPSLYRISPHSERDKTLVAKPIVSPFLPAMGASELLASTKSESLRALIKSNGGGSARILTKGSSGGGSGLIAPITITESDAILLHIPQDKTFYVWVGSDVPDRATPLQASKTIAQWMAEFEPAYGDSKIVEIKGSRPRNGSSSPHSTFWCILDELADVSAML